MLTACLVVGGLIPCVISKAGGDSGILFRQKSGELAGFVLDSLRGLPEILQFRQGEARIDQMNQRNEALSREEARSKRISGRNQAITNAAILLFDIYRKEKLSESREKAAAENPHC